MVDPNFARIATMPITRIMAMSLVLVSRLAEKY
jgi:hypothetical protein